MHLIHTSTSGPGPASWFNLVRDDDVVIGRTQIRHRASCNADLPPEAANNIYYEIYEPYRGNGYGKALFGLALEEAKRIGLNKVRATVLSNNPTSRHIIESHNARWLADFVCKKGETYSLFEVDLIKE